MFSAHISGTGAVSGSYALMTSWATPDLNTNFTFASGVLTVQQAGIYDVSAQFSTALSGTQSVLVNRNSTMVGTNTIFSSQESGLSVFGSIPVSLAAGDQLRMFGAGPSSTTISAGNPSYLSVAWRASV
jgi:hypothetical protein